MDPLSFTASLITVTALVAASSKKIYDLRGKLKSAPKDVENLLEQLRTFETLLKELETQFKDYRNSSSPHETLPQVWGSSIAQMQRDVESLQTVLSKVEPLVKIKSKSSKLLLLARQILSEKEVERYQRKIDTHCSTLTNIQTMVSGRKLDKLSQNITQLGDKDETGFRTVSSQVSESTSQLGAEVKTSFSTVSSQLATSESANGVRHQEVLAHLRDHAKSDNLHSEKMDEVFQRQLRSMDINEAGFEAVQSSLVTASSSNLEEHKTTHAMVSECQGQLQQILRKNITFRTVEHSIHSPSTHPKALDPTTTETLVFWSYRCHRLPIGGLQIHLTQTRQSGKSRRSTPQVCTKSKISVEFVPPRWLSNVMIRYSIKRDCILNNSHWRWGATLTPLTVNYNPIFINAIKSLDVEGLRTSFATGLAKPTDYVLMEYLRVPLPWYYYLLYNMASADWLPRYILMFGSMVKEGLPGQEFIMSRLSIQSYERLGKQVFQKCLYKYLKHGGKILAAQSTVLDNVFFIHKVGRVDWIPHCLFNSSEPWLVDDFSSLDICLIGTVANADAVFRDRLRKELASYRSPVLPGRAHAIDILFDATFGAASIESHFRKLEEREMYRFLALMCRTGSSSMVKPFIDMGFDVNRGLRPRVWDYNLLGDAAAAGNVDIVYMLLEAGATATLAIRTFLNDSTHLSDALFSHLLELLVENAGPASFEPVYDPLLAILQSSRALTAHSKAPEILLARKVFTDRFLAGSKNQNDYSYSYSYSYMYRAISKNNPSVVDLLLQNGAHADARISDQFECFGSWCNSCTWMTFSVLCGAASCADVLIQHGADVTALDGAGRSAIQLAKVNVLASHPRLVDHLLFDSASCRITAEEDAETLAVLERAFNHGFRGTESLEDHIKRIDELALRPPQREERPVSALRKMLQKALGIVFTPTQVELVRDRLWGLYPDIKETWSLSFYEALLMRFIYVLSYALLLALELHAFLKGHKRVPTPSRFLLSTVALLLLALVWGSSQMDFSWGPITVRSDSEVDS